MTDIPADGLPVLRVDSVTAAAARRITRRDHCACLSGRTRKGTPSVPSLHVEAQDQSAVGWGQVAQLINRVKESRATFIEPSAEIAWEEWMAVITLPAEVGSLTDAKELRAYGSHLRRLPPEIGCMSSLEDLDIYTSYSLHWLPYEVMRCTNLQRSRMSTRALYGNRKTRLPFPPLRGPIETLLPLTCSVCDRAFGERSPQLFWITLRVATDIVPLLVHSCSEDCTLSLPRPPDGYFERPHKGGGGVGMPEEGFGPFGQFFRGDRIQRLVKDSNTGEERWTSFTVQRDPKTGEVIYIPDSEP